METKSFLIYIPPSQEISDLIEKVNIKLRENHPSNTYIPLYKGKWHCHLMVYLSPMPSENEESIIDVVQKLTKEVSPFKVELRDLNYADSNYLYIGVNEDARIKLESIHNKLVEKLSPLRDQTIKEKYLQKWDSFSEEEKNRIRTTGLPYKYTPHITLGVFSGKTEQSVAYKEALPYNLKGNSFVANSIEILTSVGSNYEDKKIVVTDAFPK